jgi:glycogen(starch) synthase
LKQRGHKILILTSNHRVNKVTDQEPDVHRVLHLQSPDQDHYHPQYSLFFHSWERKNRKLFSVLAAQFSPDVIFINGMWNLSSDLAWYAEQLFPEKVVYYIASFWPTEIDPNTAYWNDPPGRKWLNIPKSILGKIIGNVSSLQTAQSLEFKRVVCVSRFMQRYMIEQVGVPDAQTTVVYNGIDTEKFSPSIKSATENPSLKLLYAGGLLEHKGVHTAIEAIGYLVNQVCVKNIHLTLVGEGHPAYVGYLKEQIRTLELEKFVTYKKNISRGQMPALLQQYGVLVFPSIWEEPLARIVQEAMACGLVVIGTETGGTPEILRDGQNSLIFDASNAKMLAEKIKQLINKPDLIFQFAQNARKTVETRFSLERMVDELETFFCEILQS